MFIEALLATAFQVGPFYEQKTDYWALRPIVAHEGDVDDVLWPFFTSHANWWRFCFFVHHQRYPEGDSQFEIMPFWFNGKDYAGLFPIGGYHPHILMMYDFKFALWPLWMQYKMPRPSEKRWMTTNAVLWPFFHWRDDGSFGIWPLYEVNHKRESDHRTVLWPIVTWAKYREDRDTAGAGYSWMVWPLFGMVDREREQQWLALPPLISHAKTPDCERTFIFPFYEHHNTTYRFGWKLVELYEDETRVFPFWVSRKDDSYFRLWPFYEREGNHTRILSLFPIRHIPAVHRNWSKFWTFYEKQAETNSLFWGLIKW